MMRGDDGPTNYIVTRHLTMHLMHPSEGLVTVTYICVLHYTSLALQLKPYSRWSA